MIYTGVLVSDPLYCLFAKTNGFALPVFRNCCKSIQSLNAGNVSIQSEVRMQFLSN